MLILESLWFLLPLIMANQCPGFAAKLALPGSHTPVSRKWLGKNKTIAAYYAAPFGALCTLYVQRWIPLWSAKFGLFYYDRPDLWIIGIVLGVAVVIGDHAKSFIKRRIGKPPGARWWPFDQLDFVVAGIILSIPLVGWIGWQRALTMCLCVLLVHPIGNRIGYRIGIRKSPW